MLHFLGKRDALKLHVPGQELLQQPACNLISLVHFEPGFLEQSNHMFNRYCLREAMQVLEY